MKPQTEYENLDRDIHDRKRRYEHTKRVFDEADILPENRELILKWINAKEEDHKISILRKEKLLGVLGSIGRTIKKPLTKLTAKDIIEYWRTIKNQPADFKTWTCAIPDQEDTTVAATTDFAYDRIILTPGAAQHFVNYLIVRDVQKEQSEHYLVSAVFNTNIIY
jgi:hypothetical protein